MSAAEHRAISSLSTTEVSHPKEVEAVLSHFSSETEAYPTHFRISFASGLNQFYATTLQSRHQHPNTIAAFFRLRDEEVSHRIHVSPTRLI